MKDSKQFEIKDPPGLKGGPGAQMKALQKHLREYYGPFRVQGDNPPVVIAKDGEALLSMMWPVHDQTPEGEQAAVEYTKGLAQQIADGLNDSASLRAQARVVELERENANRDEALNARRKYVEKCNHLPSLVIDSESGPICCECWALEEKARADRWQALLEANNDLMPTGNDFYFCVECFFRQVRGMAKEQMDVLRNCGEAIIKAEAENARLTQQLAACEKQWRPIADAPKDGTHILIAIPYINGTKLVRSAAWMKGEFGGFGWFSSSSDQSPWVEPTEWQPLPPEPSRTKEKQ